MRPRVIAKGQGWEVAKFCDHGRAIYVTDGGYGQSVAVIDRAPECAAFRAVEEAQ